MPETSLVVVDPGHFHATLVQQQMYPELSSVVRVYAPLGPDLIDYLSRIARYNRRPEAATDWRLIVHAGPDFLDRIRNEPPGGVAIFSGRNRGKIDRIIAALETGLHVLADKPAIIEPTDPPRLEAALRMANKRRLVLADMMTGRHNTLVRLVHALRSDPEVFGNPVPGSATLLHGSAAIADQGSIGAGWSSVNNNRTLRGAVQTPRRTPSSYRETALSGHERAGI